MIEVGKALFYNTNLEKISNILKGPIGQLDFFSGQKVEGDVPLLKYCLKVLQLNQERKRVLDSQGLPPIFNNYIAIQELGKGAFGRALSVYHLKDEKLFAMKELGILNQHAIDEAAKEVEIMKNLNSKFTIKLHESFSFENNFYIVMELAQDGDLKKAIEFFNGDSDTGKITSEEIYTRNILRTVGGPIQMMRWIRQLAEGIHDLHCSSIVCPNR
eukprot:TRINITY_DN1111_c0_g1_i1.p1 TRINITY_DN1111_c0_g1~~TRINITY_DN1111_c0_g1_i1.p1  ORF type:complete len:215 (+),score=33.60 TRINITY_DN1111_c0_g1_i1:1-645(+)